MSIDLTGFGAVADLGGKIIDKLWPDPSTANAAKLQLLALQQNGELAQLNADTTLAKAQIDVNGIEASSTRLFVAGWRPFIGWVCGSAYAWNFVGLSVVKTILAAVGHPITVAPLDLAEMLPVLGGLLGLGTMRMVEKVKGVA